MCGAAAAHTWPECLALRPVSSVLCDSGRLSYSLPVWKKSVSPPPFSGTCSILRNARQRGGEETARRVGGAGLRVKEAEREARQRQALPVAATLGRRT